MHVSMEHKTETKGIFKKTTTYWLHLKIAFSEEERIILKSRKLWDALMFSIPLPPVYFAYNNTTVTGKRSCSFDHASQGWRTAFTTPGDAKEFEHKLKAELLPIAKSYLEANETTGVSTTFEL